MGASSSTLGIRPVESGHAAPCHAGEAMIDVGLPPKVLLAAGLSPQQCQAMLQHASACSTELANFSAAQTTLKTVAKAQVPLLQAKPTRTLSPEAAQTMRTNAAAQIASAKTTAASAAAAFRAAVLDGTTPQVLAKLDLLKDPAVLKLAMEQGIVATSPQQATALSAAFIQEARALRHGTPVPPETASLLASVRETSMKTVMQTNIAEVDQAFRESR